MNVAGVFKPHTMPRKALPVRCHILQDDKAKILEDYMVEQLPDCYINSRQLKERKKRRAYLHLKSFLTSYPILVLSCPVTSEKC